MPPYLALPSQDRGRFQGRLLYWLPSGPTTFLRFGLSEDSQEGREHAAVTAKRRRLRKRVFMIVIPYGRDKSVLHQVFEDHTVSWHDDLAVDHRVRHDCRHGVFSIHRHHAHFADGLRTTGDDHLRVLSQAG